jgi:hypothetical protein
MGRDTIFHQPQRAFRYAFEWQYTVAYLKARFLYATIKFSTHIMFLRNNLGKLMDLKRGKYFYEFKRKLKKEP